MQSLANRAATPSGADFPPRAAQSLSPIVRRNRRQRKSPPLDTHRAALPPASRPRLPGKPPKYLSPSPQPESSRAMISRWRIRSSCPCLLFDTLLDPCPFARFSFHKHGPPPPTPPPPALPPF